ncbi:hypothetical protein ACFYUL_11120 [Streptomyces sp. NPDC004311]|uniref:hypothetical protein n=1 Tax=Streptomyces sp. NPDC004311 TaxID=3364698 RepID=UPI00368E8077
MAELKNPARSRAIRRAVLVVAVLAAALAVVVFVRGGSDTASAAKPERDWCTTDTPRTVLCPNGKVFDAKEHTTHGRAFECIYFASQADAQAVLRADPADPNRLDDGGGVACRGLPEPRDTEPVPRPVQCRPGDTRSAFCPQPERSLDARWFLRHGNDAYDCPDFASQADAQAVLRFAPGDPNRLDGDGNGIACSDLAGPEDVKPVRRGTP